MVGALRGEDVLLTDSGHGRSCSLKSGAPECRRSWRRRSACPFFGLPPSVFRGRGTKSGFWTYLAASCVGSFAAARPPLRRGRPPRAPPNPYFVLMTLPALLTYACAGLPRILTLKRPSGWPPSASTALAFPLSPAATWYCTT